MEACHAVLAKTSLSPVVEIVFRVFFALNFLGAVIEFVHQLTSHPLTRQSFGSTVGIAAIMCAVVAVMSAASLWTAQQRDRKALRTTISS
jgi:hypothetical protein